jgi:peptidoglycan-associated lipoprotein
MQQFQVKMLTIAIIACCLIAAGCATTESPEEQAPPDESTQMIEEQPVLPEETIEYETASAEQEIEEAPPEEDFPAGMGLFTSEDIYFKKGSAALTPEAQEILIQKAAWLLDHPQVTVIIQGHSDENGTAEYNLALGERRAGSVMSFLIRQGVERSRLVAVSYGKERRVDPGKSDTARANNRRTHFVIEMVEYE